MIDCILFSLPYCDQIYAPPLGLGILKAHAHRAGLKVKIIDLNIEYLDYLVDKTNSPDRETCSHFALKSFKESLCLPDISQDRIPCGLDELFGFNLSFDEIDQMIDDIIHKTFWPSLLKKLVFDRYEPTLVAGLSIMGQPQVPFALLLVRLFKEYWPGTLTIAGGSHITLLRNRIAKDSRYGKWIDLFLPGHCEEVFSSLLDAVKNKHKLPAEGIIKAGYQFIESRPLRVNDVLPPLYDNDDIAQYDNKTMFFPIQLRRGCSYAKCRFCTYRVIENYDKNVCVSKVAGRILSGISRWEPKRITIRDSSTDYMSAVEFGKVCVDILPEVTWRISSKFTTKFIQEVNIKLLHSLNCRVIEFGIESIHKNTQKLINKFCDIKLLETLFPIAAAYKIKIQLNLMFGFPWETMTDNEKQLAWFLDWHGKYPNTLYGSFTMLDVIYSSIFSTHAKQFGIELQPLQPWSSIYVWNTPDWSMQFLRKTIIPQNLIFNRSLHNEILYI